MITGCLAQTVHDRLTKPVLRKALRENAVYFLIVKFSQYRKQIVRHGSDQYKQPSLCNYYCANQCPIGAQYVPEIKVKDLAQIVLETVASLNAMQKKKERLIEITVDGQISGDELADFVYIQEELEKISVAVETLQLWCERMLDTGAIDADQYDAYKNA